MTTLHKNALQQRLQEAMDTLPSSLNTAIAPLVNEQFTGVITQDQFQALLAQSQLTDKELRLALLPLAAAFSVAPISNFYVGAIARGTSGHLYFGANMEFSNVQLGQTIHAEQSAISHAWIHGETGISDITINFSPCGHCRQFMNELTTADSLMVQLPERDEKSLQAYLPESFGPKDLGVEGGLLATTSHKLNFESTSPLLMQAFDAANRSHAPYSKNFSGVALEMNNGNIYHGMYAENAAFNPSLPPLQVALIHANMSREALSEIKKAALVEDHKGAISHLAITTCTLKDLSPNMILEYVSL
ncbi:cytidine deaminase [Aliivibrio salmonicida]|uniref:Cytidine deaminase n=1 Tax=Aliivibrio salmonicida (strain LFI1238) TaxID=316275 RepID=B6EMI3_ALISL|nr:cytidine deaminase [Aliivibrio salmonicida]AZL84911.1 cytidine deaminase [Aliivibrio salmonicida]CAQ79369.1 cytidine deaminase [Aliivibrio salmonicida LFI1238]